VYHRIGLEAAAIEALGHKACSVAKYTVADLESGDVRSYSSDFTCNMTSEDCWIGQRDMRRGRILQGTVDWVDGEGVILDQNFVLPWDAYRRRLELERYSFLGCESSRCVGDRGHTVSVSFKEM
jgi:hypothetical protein